MRHLRLTSTNTGSIHATIAVGLVVILIAALGWVFYTNFVAKETTTIDTPQQNTTSQENPEVTTKKDKVLRLEKWGAEIPIDDPALNDITVQYEEDSPEVDEDATDEDGSYSIRMPVQNPSSCSPTNEAGTVSVGRISRANPNDKDPRNDKTYKEAGNDPEVKSMVNLGQYTYIFDQIQSGPCEEDEINSMLWKKTESFYTLFQKIRSIE